MRAAWGIAVLGPLAATPALAACGLALAIGIDVSASVDAREHALQRDGMAWALSDPEVQSAFLDGPGYPVDLYIFEWAGADTQLALIPWTSVTSSADLLAIADSLRRMPRTVGQAGTGTGQAMLFGAARTAERPGCAQHTLDLATDGIGNSGIDPALATGSPVLRGVTVNGLAIGSGRADQSYRHLGSLRSLVAYLSAQVIQGPNAFVELTENFEGFSRAMKRKLLRELGVQVIGQAQDGGPAFLGGGGAALE